ncbi:MAG TPA: DUF1684 domain-containing protein [Terriglobia bacterium]|nr:DUF1684 domain-containing protein [Terriglobia bacterium]
MLTSAALLLAAMSMAPVAPEDSYRAQIEQWRARREASLKSEDGWLTVAGLFWLKRGINTVGTEAGNDIVLPAGSAPGRVGAFDMHDGIISFEAAAGVNATVNGKPATASALKPDSSESPDILRLNGLTLSVIQRHDRYGIRLKDKNSEMRKAFTGLKYFPAKEEYRVKAKFVPYDPAKTIAVPNILGQIEQTPSPGYVEFTLNGHELRLNPVTEGDTLFFIFKDLTSGKETYPPGRFLNTEMPKNGEVILDFNKAYNPPCAFTPYATCPLPPEQSKLSIAIEAGELRYGH